MIRNAIAATAALALIPAFGACGESGTSHVRVTATDTNALRQGLAEAPLAGFEQICLNVTSVRVRIAADDDATTDEDGVDSVGDGWYDLQLATPEEEEAPAEGEPVEPELAPCPSLDLVQLLTHQPIAFAWGEVPSGHMTEMRFVLGADQGYAVMTGDEEVQVPVLVPSGSQSGLKLKFSGSGLDLAPNEEQEVVVEFDGQAMMRDHEGGAIRIRPVIKVRGTETVPVDDEEENGSEDPSEPVLQ
ncbi:DUF4382 domain-containing protein [Vulgatibacter sp.]|uniref:DUF4382 domain-containing protein n=1 Tax=Vulgatibacter sp. TaxID=1971226 RepID=UPI0035662E16